MSLDIHVANNLEEAEQQYPVLSITENLHRAIFVNKQDKYVKYLSFCRLNDYYSDVTFLGDEILELLSDLKAIQTNSKDDEISTFVSNFIKVCLTAIDAKVGIYCFCD